MIGRRRRRSRAARALDGLFPVGAIIVASAIGLSDRAAATDADAPRVVADIAPVHSLVARVMVGVGEPRLLLRAGVSPHDHALRPSQAAALEAADLVVWTAAGLTPWLPDALAALAPSARSVELIGRDDTRRLPAREAALFALEDAGPADAGAHADDGDRPAVDGGARDDHGHGPFDPHVWLDPANARVWLAAIAEELVRLDPQNAARYRTNAARGQDEIDALIARTESRLLPLRGRPFVVFHDGFRYFEERFGLPARGAILGVDAVAPSPARIAALRERIAAEGIRCVFVEPQLDPKLLGAVTVGNTVASVALDPLGGALEPGPALYPALIDAATDAFADCLG